MYIEKCVRNVDLWMLANKLMLKTGWQDGNSFFFVVLHSSRPCPVLNSSLSALFLIVVAVQLLLKILE